MKKILSLILAFIMCFSFVSFATAANEAEVETETVSKHQQDNLGFIDEILPTEDNGKLEKIIDVTTKIVTYFYDYATQPEEPAVDLETVLTIVEVIVKAVYWVIENYA